MLLSMSLFTHPSIHAGFWMSDKPLVQQALATDLANILLSIPNIDSSLQFLRGFWEALVREWSGLDRLRYARFRS